MRRVMAGVAVCLAGCNTPGPLLRDAEVHRVDLPPHVYQLRQNGPYVQVMRVDFALNARIATVATGAERAAEQVTGCDVAWLQGDVAVMLAGLSCDGAKPPKPPRRSAPQVFFCDLRPGGGAVVLDCAR